MYESTSASELRGMLVSSGKFTEEQANGIKGKSNLVYELKKLGVGVQPVQLEDMIEDMLDSATPEIPSPVRVEEENYLQTVGPILPVTRVPNMTDMAWQDYVLSYLDKDKEYFKGNPKVCGLRRVAQLLLGEIVESGPVQIFPATSENTNGRASVLYQIRIAWRNTNLYADPNQLDIRTFMSVAEGWDGNIQPGIYQAFPLTIAETRAEGRALRKALMLNVVTAEEMKVEVPNEVVNVVEEWNGEDKASSQQLNSLNMISGRVGVEYGKLVPDVNKLTRQRAVELLKELNSYQSGETVPENLRANAQEEKLCK